MSRSARDLSAERHQLAICTFLASCPSRVPARAVRLVRQGVLRQGVPFARGHCSTAAQPEHGLLGKHIPNSK